MNLRSGLKVLKEEGLGGFWVRIKQKVVVVSDMYQIDLKTIDHKADEEEGTAFMLTPMTQALCQQMVEAYSTEISLEKKEMLWKRLDEKSTDRVYLLVDQDGAIVGFYCISYGDNVDDETNYVVKAVKGSAFLFDAYTFISHRKRGAQKYATIALLKMLQEKGLDTATVMIDSTNLYSQKATLKYGFHKIEVVKHINLGLWKGNIERKYDRNDR